MFDNQPVVMAVLDKLLGTQGQIECKLLRLT